MGDLFSLYAYFGTYAHTGTCNAQIMLWVSCRPIEFCLPRGLDGMRDTTLSLDKWTSVRCLQGLQSSEQLHMESNSECSPHLLIPQIHKVSRSQRLGYK